MADAMEGVAGKAAVSTFRPRPSITIVTFWKGILEMVRRFASLVSFSIRCYASVVRQVSTEEAALVYSKVHMYVSA